MTAVPPADTNRGTHSREERGTARWLERVCLALWLGAVAFFVQFALASTAELEPQAAVMGWMFVVILLAGGGSVIGARRLDRGERD
ncbi:MAG: hypothetical protein ACYC3S_14360 [Chloroflexota bacterium]